MKSLKAIYDHMCAVLPSEDISVKRRLERAYDIVIGTEYTILEWKKDCYKVMRASSSLLSDNSATYYVDADSCTCPDYPTARAGLCKHRLAVEMTKGMTA